MLRLVGLILLSGCTTKMLQVKIEGFQSPRDSFKEMSSLAILLDPEFDASFDKNFMNEFASCTNFKSHKKLENFIELGEKKDEELKKSFAELIKKDDNVRSYTGILVLDLVKNKMNNSMEKSTAYSYRDLPELSLKKNFGIPKSEDYGYSTGFELAPARKIARKPVFIRKTAYDYKIRYLLYNRVTDSVAVLREEAVKSSFSNYSRKPSLSKADVRESIFSGVRKRIRNKVCGRTKPIDAEIYRSPQSRPVDELVNKGFELALEGRWKLAATQWENALAKDKKHGLAHHNLAVYYEYAGTPEKAYLHYRREHLGPFKEVIKKPGVLRYFDDYLYPSFTAPKLAQISFITGGHWIYTTTRGQKLKIGKTYSVYRIEMNRTETEGEVEGTHVREVGKVRFLRKTDDYYQGRIRQTIVDYPILPGDFIMF